MSRTYLGYGYTNSEGVATLDYDAEDNPLPKKSYACHSRNTSVVAEVSVDNVVTSSNSIRFCEDYVPPNDTLSLTADKSVLSYADNDTATLTATYEGETVSGKSVVFKIGDTVLDTIQTDSEGVAEYTYNSQGVGDVTFTVECMNLQETYEIEDLYWYSSDGTKLAGTYTTGSDSSYSYITGCQSNVGLPLTLTLPSAFELSYKHYDNYSGSDISARNGLWRIGSDENNGVLIGSEASYERIRIYNRSSGSNSVQQTKTESYTRNQWNEFKIRYENGVWTVSRGENNVSYSKSFTINIWHFNETFSASRFSDFKLKQL